MNRKIVITKLADNPEMFTKLPEVAPVYEPTPILKKRKSPVINRLSGIALSSSSTECVDEK